MGVVQWHIPGGGDGGVVGSRITRQGGGAWAETRNRAVMAQFRVRRAERRWGTVRGGGAVARTRWWWWWGRAVVKHEKGKGVWVKPQNRAAVAWFRARRVDRGWRMVRGGGTMARTRWWRWWGRGVAHRKAGGGFGSKLRNRGAVARFRAATGLQEVEGGCCGVTAPPPVLT